MLVKFLSPKKLLIASLPEDMEDYEVMIANKQLLKSKLPNDVEIVDIPIAPENGSYENLGNIFYSYTNSLLLNNVILVPLYGERTDDLALDTYKTLCPEKEIIGIYCKDIIHLKGAIHCMCVQI